MDNELNATDVKTEFNAEISLVQNDARLHSLDSDVLHLWPLLEQYNLQTYFARLTQLQINVACFKSMTEEDLREIFQNELGPRIIFRGLVNDWRAQHNIAPMVSCCCHHNRSWGSVPNTAIASLDRSWNGNSVPNTTTVSMEDLSESSSSTSRYQFNIDRFLSSANGAKIKIKYQEQNSLQSTDRDALVSSIVREHLDNDVPMTLAMFEEISKELVQTFKTEKEEYYFQKLPKPCGKLYNKYRSMAAAFKSAGFFSSRLRKAKRTTNIKPTAVPDINPTESKLVPEQIENKHWLYCNKTDEAWLTVQTKWADSFPTRRDDVLKLPLSQFISEWPVLKGTDAYRLIDIDFKKLAPGKESSIFVKWKVLEKKTQTLFPKFVKFPAAKTLLKELSANTEIRTLQLFKIIHSIVKPVARKYISGQVWKVSISEAWNSFVLEANTWSDISNLVNQRKQFCATKSILFQPFLVVVQNNADEQPKFLLTLDIIHFTFSSFLQALDTYFKIFFVFNLQYPFESSQFWHFVQTYFYDIPTETSIESHYYDFIHALRN